MWTVSPHDHSVARSGSLEGAVVVSTPQDVALIDARKGVGMFNKVSIPVRLLPTS